MYGPGVAHTEPIGPTTQQPLLALWGAEPRMPSAEGPATPPRLGARAEPPRPRRDLA